MRTKIVCIYKITSPSGKVYIGQTTYFQKRKESYNRLAFKNQAKLYSSVIKHGWNTHKLEIIHELPIDVSQEILNIYEQFYWQQYINCGVEMLNLIEPGNATRHSLETIDKIRKNSFFNGKSGDKNPMWGKFGSKHPTFAIPKSENWLKTMSKPVMNTLNNEIYPSLKAAAKKLGVTYMKAHYHIHKDTVKDKLPIKFLNL